MDEYEEIDHNFRILPGVDLALWSRIVFFVLLALVAAGIAVAVA